MAWIEISPGNTSLFQHETAPSFPCWTGILVNRHRHRQVEKVFLPSPSGSEAGSEGATFFLKKETAVTWRDRFRNAWQGFGWCSTAVREAKLLLELREAGVACPEVAAFGEDGRQAFVLLRDEADMTELRSFLPTLLSADERRRVAESLGRELAHMHDAGFEHPDLFAKHILVEQFSKPASDAGACAGHNPASSSVACGLGATYRFCLLDWQRGRQRRAVSWRLRCRDLAALDATLHDSLASERLRLRCLRAYRRALTNPPPLGRLARRIRRAADVLQRKRNIREVGQLPVPTQEQQMVSLCEGRLLVVRSYYEKLIADAAIREGEAPAEPLATRERCVEPARQEPRPPVAVPDELKHLVDNASTHWDLAPLAHTLFRLHRFGVAAPRLLAASSSAVITTHDRTISLAEALATTSVSLRSKLLRQADIIVARIHEAGYRLPTKDAWAHALGVIAGTEHVMLTKVELLEETVADWQSEMPSQGRERQVIA